MREVKEVIKPGKSREKVGYPSAPNIDREFRS